MKFETNYSGQTFAMRRANVMKKAFVILGFIVCSLLGIPSQSFAAETAVNISLPNFSITLNGIEVDNTYRQYPIITYEGITYFPLTYNDCRFLGLTTDWDVKKGLQIKQDLISALYLPEQRQQKNAAQATAQIAQLPITINQQPIINAQEKYPFLLFRDVTYFPLTWQYAHNMFQWRYQFSPQTGLAIDSTNKVVTDVKPADNSYGTPAVLYQQNLIWRKTGSDLFYQAPLHDLTKSQEILTLPEQQHDSPYQPYFNWCNNVLGLHVLSHEKYPHYYMRDGAFKEKVEQFYQDFGGYELYFDIDYPPASPFVKIAQNGGPKTLVGGINFIPSMAVIRYYLVDDSLYLLGRIRGEADDRVYRYHLPTQKLSVAYDRPADDFILEDGYLTIAYKNEIYAISDTGQAQLLLTDLYPDWLGGNEGNITKQRMVRWAETIYYVDTDKHLRSQRKTDLLSPGEVEGLQIMGNYLVVTFTPTKETPHRLIIMNDQGKIIFQTDDNFDPHEDGLSIDEDLLFYTYQGHYCLVDLAK